MIKKLVLNDFRIFNNHEVILGTTITAIAGQNATGKSTILGVLGNACEIKAARGKTITNKRFQTEFSEIMKGSQTYDKKNGEIGTLYYEYPTIEGINELSFRVTWQKWNPEDEEATRFRIIPKRHYDVFLEKETESKLMIPSFYLGLSRLNPLGEEDIGNIKEHKISKSLLTEEDLQWLYKNYTHILSLNSEIESISNYSMGKKISGGVNTQLYDYIGNSSGQDNLMQILYALLSFRKLYIESCDKEEVWTGGLLLIDEIDATLHPAAQIKLIDLIYNICKEICIQVVFTTHSLQILEYLDKKNKKMNDINIAYFTTANSILQIINNPPYEAMENDMLISDYYSKRKVNQIALYSEDDEARWFIKRLLKDYISRIKIIEVKLGGESLLNLLQNDPSYFRNVLFVLDGDKDISKTKYKDLPSKHCNIVILPGNTSPEKLIYNYLIGLHPTHEILESNFIKGLTIRMIEENGPLSDKYSKYTIERERFKEWFKDNKVMLEDIDVLEFWKQDYPNEYKEFIQQFLNRYNIVAARTNLPKIN
ncbi:AAA family ATPase [Niameybacter massiliensis]|uniref:AAA family ATPase n=1 Tax=Holtiella tumoricola TaxID=3018743 RepID=A0AA42J264_9FIRM|nr:AAA family ATPase [Holtiella tumoricola]MDA3732843.1 AAA family ATPase [Holtiella tumoricola]